MLTTLLQNAVMFSARKPWAVLLGALALVIAALAWSATHFDMTTDTGQLISAETEWRKNDAAITQAFPEQADDIAIIIDGKTPELADLAAARLAAALAEDKVNFVRVQRPDANEFFARSGLLYSSLDEVKATTAKLIDAQPMLGGLAYDPSLRGIADTLATAAGGAADDSADPATARLEDPLTRLHAATSAKLAGKQAWFSWQELFSTGEGQLKPPLRQIVLAQPKLTFQDLQPGSRATEAINAKARELQIDAEHGLKLGQTGEISLSDEEFGSIQEGMGLIGLLMAVSMLIALWFATKSGKTVAAIAITIIAGLAITLGGGLLAAGQLNLISIAFIPLFVGLGVDFGIQVSVRFNAERHAGADIHEALKLAAAAIGAPILLAAGAICLALGAFLPTDYVGISELGIISAFGMVVALILNVTLLPALLVLLKPAAPKDEVAFLWAAPIDHWLATIAARCWPRSSSPCWPASQRCRWCASISTRSTCAIPMPRR